MAAGGTDPQPVDHLTGWPAEDKRNEERSLALKIVIVGNGKVGFSLAEQLDERVTDLFRTGKCRVLGRVHEFSIHRHAPL